MRRLRAGEFFFESGLSPFEFPKLTLVSHRHRNVEQDAETMRRQVIGDPRLMAELRRVSDPRLRLLAILARLTPRALSPLNAHRPTPISPTQRKMIRLASANSCTSSNPCKNRHACSANARWRSSRPILSTSKLSKRSKKPSGTNACWRTWSKRWSLCRNREPPLCAFSFHVPSILTGNRQFRPSTHALRQRRGERRPCQSFRRLGSAKHDQ